MAQKKLKLLIFNAFSQEGLLLLQKTDLFEIKKFAAPKDAPAEDIQTANAFIIRSKSLITEELLDQAKQLQVIVTGTSGFDHIDLEAAQKWGVTVMHCPLANRESAAQLTWGLVLSCVHKIPQAFKNVKSGEWVHDSLKSFELQNKTYGIVGLGRIGSRVAQLAKAFDMKVIAYDPYQEDSVYEELDVERVAYEEVLKRSDILSFHVPKTLETDHMLNRSHFEYIHRGIVLINSSRGSVINENDLCEALENGWISMAGLDVFEKEPLSRNSRLLQLQNVVLTPHIGALSHEAFLKASQMAAHKILDFFRDGSASDSLPPKAPWYGATPHAFED